MTRKPVSVRLNKEDRRFVQDTDFDFTEKVRDFINNQRIAHTAGRCAACGCLVYTTDGHTLVSPGTPLHRQFDEIADISFDLCNDCGTQAYESANTPDASPPAIIYLEKTPPPEYVAERSAISKAKPDNIYLPLARPVPSTRTDPQRVALLLLWAADSGHDLTPTDLAEVLPSSVVNSVEEQVADESIAARVAALAVTE